jgi:hypothetical protein
MFQHFDQLARGCERERLTALSVVLRPLDAFMLCFKNRQNMVGVIFNCVVIDGCPSGRPLGRAST